MLIITRITHCWTSTGAPHRLPGGDLVNLAVGNLCEHGHKCRRLDVHVLVCLVVHVTGQHDILGRCGECIDAPIFARFLLRWPLINVPIPRLNPIYGHICRPMDARNEPFTRVWRLSSDTRACTSDLFRALECHRQNHQHVYCT